jgi:hypothetical protein
MGVCRIFNASMFEKCYFYIKTEAASVVQGLARWTLVPKFVGSNLAEAVGFFRAKKSPARLPSEGR